MSKYIYVDNSNYLGTDPDSVKIVFECEAEDILAADEKYEQALGKSPKQKYIAVREANERRNV